MCIIILNLLRCIFDKYLLSSPFLQILLQQKDLKAGLPESQNYLLSFDT